jgi:hypothetical protein
MSLFTPTLMNMQWWSLRHALDDVRSHIDIVIAPFGVYTGLCQILSYQINNLIQQRHETFTAIT